MRHVPIEIAAALAFLTSAASVSAATITVGPGDDFTKIEAAQPGDTVLIQPGTYQYRVYLSQVGTAEQPITIQAADPRNPPVWDLGGQTVDQWPGSYTGGDNDRGCWQVVGAHYVIKSIVFKNCRNAGQNAAGIRTHASQSLHASDLTISESDDGFTGDGEDTVIEFSDIGYNGSPESPAETHNLYIHGGSFTLRYSYLHDSVQGQNFHIRAREATLEYNWIARANNYEGDMMPGDAPPLTQTLTLRGNVILGKDSPENGGQLLLQYNDVGQAGYSFKLILLHNTIVVASGTNPALVHVANSGLDEADTVMSNNIVTGTDTLFAIDQLGKPNFKITGKNNWVPKGADSGVLPGSIEGTDPGFTDAMGNDFTLAEGSACIGAAAAGEDGAPDREYYRDETIRERFRFRTSHADLGAFEHDTLGSSFGAYDTPVEPAGSTSVSSSSAGGGGGSGGSGGGTMMAKGCGCRVAGDADPAGAAVAIALAAIGLGRRRQRARASR